MNARMPHVLLAVTSLLATTGPSTGQTTAADGSSSGNRPLLNEMLLSKDDGWPDLSGFLDQDWGFLPLVVPISEPAVGYGAAAGPVFIDTPEGGGRPNITAVAGLGTENGTWGAIAGDSRYWMDGRLQTLVGGIYSSENLDFYGIGRTAGLRNDPLQSELEPKGGLIRGKYQIGDSPWWAGAGYAYFATGIGFDAPATTPHLPDIGRESVVAGLAPTISYDSRDNIFTSTKGSYFEITGGLFSEALGGDDEFQRVQMTGIHYIPLAPKWFLGLRGDASASFGDAPFYLEPFVQMRGVAAMRYQGEQVVQTEVELRWQFWERVSAVGFAGCGSAWNDFERFERHQTVTSGGFGLRYELARKYGIHAGIDVAFGPDDPTVYIQIGSAWMRP